MLSQINEIVSSFLIECLRNSEDDNFDHLILATIKNFAFDWTTVSLLKEAILHESWELIIEGKKMAVVLTFKEKIAFLKILCSSPFVSEEERM